MRVIPGSSAAIGLLTTFLLAWIAVPPPAAAEVTEVPKAVWAAGEQNSAALGLLSVAWERRRTSPYGLTELLRRLGPAEENQGFFEPYRVRLYRDHDKF